MNFYPRVCRAECHEFGDFRVGAAKRGDGQRFPCWWVDRFAESLEAPLNADDTADVGPDAASAPGGLAK
ncbi:hypothetical protein GCM10010528_29640 [Gordonia defluvii]|uniref:Uncharacterized protein n=1 Tax=Gordonia defluvii TaxID=283718 RepID=A0ABP6LKA2_9ACTN